MKRLPILSGAALLLFVQGCRKENTPTTTGAKVDFNRDVQPILAEHCYHCHGPDPGSRQKGLRLDLAETAFAKRPGRPDAIIPGKPEASELVKRIHGLDGRMRMPPPDAVEKPLTPEEDAMLVRWIREGAVYRPHWAFEKPVRPAIPAIAGASGPIDAFILRKLAEKGLKPNGPEGRRELIRRVTLDLTGLLPTPAETEAFVADTTPDAYEKVVDRLLAAPTYGEQRARYWLDAARYGDTHGIHIDNYRAIWPYRDYVVRSFNANKPFDTFVHEQLAGDMEAPRNVDAIIATGFVRAGISSGEGGTLVEELRVNNKRERTEAYGAVFLGLTVGCANCHDHKFDPTTQKDFFALSAYFNNLTENPSNDDRADWPPNIRIPKPENRAAYDRVLSQKSDILRKIDARRRDAHKLVAAWEAAGANVAPVPETGLKLRLRFDENKGAELHNSAPGAKPAKIVATGGAPLWGGDTWFWPSFRMDTNTRVAIPEIGDVGKNSPFSAGTWVMPRLETAASSSPQIGSILSRMDAKSDYKGWDLYYDSGKVVFHLIAHWPDNAIKVSSKTPHLKRGRWNHVFATYDGSGKAAGVKIYVDGVAVETVAEKDTLSGDTHTKAPFQLGTREPDNLPLRQSRYQDLRYYDRCLPPDEASRVAYADRVAEILRKPAASRDDDEFKALEDYYFANIDKETRELTASLAPENAELAKLSKGGDLTLVCREADTLAYADVLSRGEYTDRMERVRPAIPAFLPQPPANAPRDRRTLADWTVSPENPLTARVTVNRMWSQLFGTGIVASADDFGIMGERPSDPDLLDWLAVEFRESGWNVKGIFKKMVMSDAYRRASKITPEMLEKDPGNRFFARGPRYRMDAEMLRDTALQAAGLLSRKEGGPPVKPYMPANVWESVAYPASNTLHYKQDSGESLYRRSLYTFRKRQALAPNMETLDAPVPDASCTRRARTDTPLQALVTLNDPQWVEAARFLGERVMREGGTATDSRLDFLGKTLLGRAPDPETRRILTESLARFQKHYAEKPADAEALLATGQKPRDPALKPAELAAWALVSSQMLNLDATLNK